MNGYDPTKESYYVLLEESRRYIEEMQKFVNDYKKTIGDLSEKAARNKLRKTAIDTLNDALQGVSDQSIENAVSKLSKDKQCIIIFQ